MDSSSNSVGKDTANGPSTLANESKTDEEIETFLYERKAKTTAYKDKSDYTRFKTFLRQEDSQNDMYKDTEIEDIPARELDKMLCKFFMHARKQNGELYQPDSLTSIQNSLQRVLTGRGSKINLKTSMEFERSRKVLAARRKQQARQFGNTTWIREQAECNSSIGRQ